MTVDTSKLERELKFVALVKSTEETVRLGNEALQKIASIRNDLHLIGYQISRDACIRGAKTPRVRPTRSLLQGHHQRCPAPACADLYPTQYCQRR